MDVIHKSGTRLSVSEFRNLKTIRHNEVARAVASKLIHDPSNKGDVGYNGKLSLEEGFLSKLSNNTATNIEDLSYIFQTLPDVKTAMEIWVSCLMSPKDSVTESITWRIDNKRTEYSSELFGEMLNELREYFEKEYKLADIVRPAIEDALFKTGSYALVVIPESEIDDVINGKKSISAESYREANFKNNDGELSYKGIGLLGPVKKAKGQKVGLEAVMTNRFSDPNSVDYRIHPGLTVSDNPDILKMKPVISKVSKSNIRKSLYNRFGLETYAAVSFSDDPQPGTSEPKEKLPEKDRKKVFDSKIRQSVVQGMYQERAYDGTNIVVLKDSKSSSRLPITHPLVMHIPSEAVIPIHVPGNPRDIIGAFIVLDEFGNPVRRDKENDLYTSSKNKDSQNVQKGMNLLKQMNFYNSANCQCKGDDRETLNDIAKVYGSLVEEDLLSRLTNGVYGENIEISHVDEIYRIMFARALTAMKTQVFYCPAELLTYFAFDYNRYGIGKSILEDSRILAEMRAAITYAEIYSSIENSIGRRKLTITLDEADPQPQKTIETVRSEYMRVNAWRVPTMSEGPIDAVNVLREANIDTVIQGDNKLIPNTQVELEDVNTQRIKPDDTLKEDVRKLHIASLGIPATLIDETQNSQFATTAMTAHALFNKRVVAYQDLLSNNLLKDHVEKYVLNDGHLIKVLSGVIKRNKILLTDEQRALGSTLPIIEDFLMSLEISLPSPDTSSIDEQQKDFDQYKGFVDNVIDYIFDNEAVQAFMPEQIAESVDQSKRMFKSVLISRYIEDNNYLPALRNLLDYDEKDDLVSAEIKSYIQPFVRMTKDLLLAAERTRKLEDDPKLKGIGDTDGSDYGSTGSGVEEGEYSADDGDFDVGDGEDLDEQINGKEGDGDSPVNNAIDDIDSDLDKLDDLKAPEL